MEGVWDAGPAVTPAWTIGPVGRSWSSGTQPCGACLGGAVTTGDAGRSAAGEQQVQESARLDQGWDGFAARRDRGRAVVVARKEEGGWSRGLGVAHGSAWPARRVGVAAGAGGEGAARGFLDLESRRRP